MVPRIVFLTLQIFSGNLCLIYELSGKFIHQLNIGAASESL